MDLIEELRKTDRQLRDPYAEKMATAPIICEDLKWTRRGWSCRCTENRRTHNIQQCPVAFGLPKPKWCRKEHDEDTETLA